MSVGARKRIKWKNIEIGDYAFVTFDYQGNNEVRIIPDAVGVKVRGTNELGGGYYTINVSALVVKENRFSIEQFFYNLNSVFTLTTKGTLTIEDENGTLDIANCYLDSYSQGGEDLKAVTFNFKFIKSL